MQREKHPAARAPEVNTMVEINITYEGDLRCTAVHVSSGTTLRTDAPRDNMGKGESFSPTDLIATGLGTCMMTTMGIVARKMGLDLAGTHVKVVKEMIATPTAQDRTANGGHCRPARSHFRAARATRTRRAYLSGGQEPAYGRRVPRYLPLDRTSMTRSRAEPVSVSCLPVRDQRQHRAAPDVMSSRRFQRPSLDSAGAAHKRRILLLMRNGAACAPLQLQHT